MKTKLKFFLVLLALMLGRENGVWANITYSFNSNNTSISAAGTVNNSSGDAVTIISVGDGSNDISINKQIAVTGPLAYQIGNEFGWWFHDDGLECRANRILSILNLFEGDQIKITYYILNGGNSTTIRSNNLSYNNSHVNSGTELVSEQIYTMERNGSFDLNVGRYLVIYTIEIVSGTSNRIAFDYSSSMESRTYNNVTLPFYRCRLSSRNFVEPNLSVYPGNANVTYTVETIQETDDKKPAIIRSETIHEVMMLNQGVCKVTASANGQSVSYYLEIFDDVASYSVTSITNGKKYQLTGPGRIHTRTISEVPGVKMTFSVTEGGSAPNTTVVYQDNQYGSHYVAFTNDDYGWWDRTPTNNHTTPEQGTFYAFKATVKGKLRFGGIKQNPTSSDYDPGKVYIVKIDPSNGYPQAEIFTYNQNGYLDSKDFTPAYDSDHFNVIAGNRENNYDGYIELETGWTYYLQGEANDEDSPNRYAPFLLEWFSYELDEELVLNKTYTVSTKTGYEIGNNGSYTASDVFVSGMDITIGAVECKGSIGSASVAIANNQLVFSNITFNKSGENKMGGAIKVRLSSGTNVMDFTLTIPYGKHVWDFRQTAHQSSTNPGDWSYDEAGLVNMMTNNRTNFDNWKLVWKVTSADQQQLLDPILSVNNNINGDNAFYMTNTAGLVFVTGPRSFGALDTREWKSSNYEQRNAMTASETTKADILMTKGNATIYFPGVKENQYIKIYTYRHSINKGENFYARNLVDLDGKTYNNTSADNYFKMYGATYETSDRYKGDGITGAAIFRVPDGYTPTNDLNNIPSLTLCDDGWMKIFRIEIMDEFEPDLFMPIDISSSDQGTDINKGGYISYDSPASSVVLKKKGNTVTPVTNYYWAAPGWVGSMHGNTCRYEVIPTNVSVTSVCDQTSEKPNYNRLVLTYNSGNGYVRIIQREVTNKAGSCVTSTVGPVTSATDYVIDKKEYRINVGELVVQDYPYTWDFTNYNMNKDNRWSNGTSASETAIVGSSSAEYGKWTETGTETRAYNLDVSKKVTMGTNDEGAYPSDNSKTDPYQNVQIDVPTSTQGADMKAGTTRILEGEGLGVSLPVILKDYQTDATNWKRDCKAYDVTGHVTLDGNTLSGAGELTIPDVDAGMYIFVQASQNPSFITKVNNVDVTNYGIKAINADGTYTVLTGIGGTDSDPFRVKPGVYLYQNTTGSKLDIIVPFVGGADVQIVAVTDIVKEIGTTGYATESRDHVIDHTYQGRLTSHDVKAYAITTYNGETYNYKGYPMVKKSDPISVVPQKTGIVLYEDLPSGVTTHTAINSPLFYPAVNHQTPSSADVTTLATNWMAPSIARGSGSSGLAADGMLSYSETIDKGTAQTGTADGTGCTKFILSSAYWVYEKDGTDPGATESQLNNHTTTAAFYRMRLVDGHNTLAGNKAYLLIPTANLPTALWNKGNGQGIPGQSREGVIYIDLQDLEENDATAIDNENAVIDCSADNGVYYSISGARINGKPTAKGFYIHNGKKVSIK